MANEIVWQVPPYTHDTFDFTVADGTAITKGALMKITSPRTAIISSAALDYLAGIAARDKGASDGRTQMAIITKGLALVYLSGAGVVGQYIGAADTSTYPNYFQVINSGAASVGALSGGVICGKLTQTGANGQVEAMLNFTI